MIEHDGPFGEEVKRGKAGDPKPGPGLLEKEESRAVISVQAAARLLGKSRDTIYRWLTEGRLAGRRVGGRWLVFRDSVEEKWRSGLVQIQRADPPRRRSRVLAEED